MDKAGIKGTYLGEAVVVFEGSLNEKLDANGFLNGEDAVLANITVYGPNGQDDIAYYQGYTMSSDSEKFGVVADGTYDVNRLSSEETPGPYGSDLTLNNRGPVPAMNGYNPAYPDRTPGYLTGVFIHRSNKNGWAGAKYNPSTKSWMAVSKGCLLVMPNQWNGFSKQLSSLNNFKVQINRK